MSEVISQYAKRILNEIENTFNGTCACQHAGKIACGLKWFTSPCDRTFDSLARRAFGMKVDAASFASQPPRPQRQKQPFMSRSSLIRWMGASLTGQTITRAVSISQITRRAFDVSRVTHLLDKLHT